MKNSVCMCVSVYVYMFTSVTERKGHRERDGRKEEERMNEEEGRRNEMIKSQIKEQSLV